MSEKCPKCSYKVNTNLNYECPGCGDKFWQSRKSFESYVKYHNLLIEDVKNIDDKPTYKSKKVINKLFVKLSWLFLILWLGCILLFFAFASITWVALTTFVLGFISFICMIVFFAIRVSYIPDEISENVTKSCQNCDKNDDDAKYCIYCGEKIKV